MSSTSWYTEIRDTIEKTSDVRQLERLRTSVLGRKGSLNLKLKDLSHLAPEQRKKTRYTTQYLQG